MALHAVEGACREIDEPALVIGAGPVGLAIVLWLANCAPGTSSRSDPVAGRRAMAERSAALPPSILPPPTSAWRSSATGAARPLSLECSACRARSSTPPTSPARRRW